MTGVNRRRRLQPRRALRVRETNRRGEIPVDVPNHLPLRHGNDCGKRGGSDGLLVRFLDRKQSPHSTDFVEKSDLVLER